MWLDVASQFERMAPLHFSHPLLSGRGEKATLSPDGVVELKHKVIDVLAAHGSHLQREEEDWRDAPIEFDSSIFPYGRERSPCRLWRSTSATAWHSTRRKGSGDSQNRRAQLSVSPQPTHLRRNCRRSCMHAKHGGDVLTSQCRLSARSGRRRPMESPQRAFDFMARTVWKITRRREFVTKSACRSQLTRSVSCAREAKRGERTFEVTADASEPHRQISMDTRLASAKMSGARRRRDIHHQASYRWSRVASAQRTKQPVSLSTCNFVASARRRR